MPKIGSPVNLSPPNFTVPGAGFKGHGFFLKCGAAFCEFFLPRR
jgi:hypothetical protein